MGREILFKAKRVDNGEWVTGFYYLDPEGGHFIHDFEYILDNGNFDEPPHGYFQRVYFQVHPETVCQFTGLLDKNGNKIFEGDNGCLILKGIGKGECTIEFESGCFVINANGQTKKMPLVLFDSNYHEIEITGNIHDK